MYVGLAIGIVILMALVVKPIMTGQPVVLWDTGEETVPEPTVTYIPYITASPTTPVPTPTPKWKGVAQNVSFVDPSTYHVNFDTGSSINITPQPPSSGPNSSANNTLTMIPYATIVGQWSGTTDIVYIPFPYWQLDYSNTVPLSDDIARLNIQVMDADDPNRFVRSITVPFTAFKAVGINTNATGQAQRQWTETFYEGYKKYYFVINTIGIKSYNIKILIPQKYV